MNAYTPTSAAIVGACVVLLAAALTTGRSAGHLPARASRLATWTITVTTVAAILGLTSREPPGVRMLAIAGALLVGMKAVVAASWHARTGRTLPLRAWLGFIAWPGMRPAEFATLGAAPRRLDVWPGVRGLIAGVGLLAVARFVHGTDSALGTIVALPALSLILQFGLFRLLAVLWAARGADVNPVFDAPLRAVSLRDFWGGRWNRGFSDMIAIAVYRPVARAFGTRAGLAAAFAFSGVLHELAISVPVRAGYGGPLAYFALHGGLVAMERVLEARGLWFRRPASARAWAMAWLVLPLPLLFHAPFRDGVVRPLLE